MEPILLQIKPLPMSSNMKAHLDQRHITVDSIKGRDPQPWPLTSLGSCPLSVVAALAAYTAIANTLCYMEVDSTKVLFLFLILLGV